MIMPKVIMGVALEQRIENAAKVQELLTKYGCSIGTRLGLHSASTDSCSPRGLIILEFIDGAEKEADELERELLALGGVIVRRMEF